MLGQLIKEARTAAKLTQEKLGNAVGLTASDISKAEKETFIPTNEDLKEIAKVTGVTQKSLLDAAKADKEAAAKKTSAKKPAAAASSSAKKTTTASSKKTTTAASSSSAKKTTTTSSSTKKTTTAAASSSAGVRMQLSTTEAKLIERWRAADSDTKKKVTALLKGETTDASDIFGDAMENIVEMLTKKVIGGK